MKAGKSDIWAIQMFESPGLVRLWGYLPKLAHCCLSRTYSKGLRECRRGGNCAPYPLQASLLPLHNLLPLRRHIRCAAMLALVTGNGLFCCPLQVFSVSLAYVSVASLGPVGFG